MMRMSKKWGFVAAAFAAFAVTLCPLKVFAGDKDAAALVDWFQSQNIPNSGVLEVPGAADGNLLLVVCQPSGIIRQEDGTFLVTDLYNKVIWKIDGDSTTIFAGKVSARDLSGEPLGGYADGMLKQALFKEPWDIVPFMDGYAVSDSANHVVRYIEKGKVRTAAGNSTPGFQDGNALTLSVMLNNPTGLAADDKGNLFIADTGNGAIRRLDSSGKVITCITGLSEPTGLFWQEDVLYLADSGNNRICKLTGLYDGNGMDTTLTVIAGGKEERDEEEIDFLDGDISSSRFLNPQGVTVTNNGDIYVADTGNGAIRRISDGQVSTLLKLDSQKMGTYPVSPRSLLAVSDTLYFTDSFCRMVLTVMLP